MSPGFPASHTYFSNSYTEARIRFRDAAKSVNADLTAYQIHTKIDENLSIDVAVLNDEAEGSTLVVSSGVHGVEAFVGSAIQLAWLDRIKQGISSPDFRCVFIHSVNPFGFSQLRRVNEDNIDINRNFFTDIKNYNGAHSGYADLNKLLNPESAPSRYEPFRLKALWYIARKGLPFLKQAIASGQYEYPQGLFFGGKQPSQSTRIIQGNLEKWIGSSKTVVHIDLHSGLGKSGTYTLLLAESLNSKNYPWYIKTFGKQHVEAFVQPDGTTYAASGILGEWVQEHFKERNYRFVTAEFGTYNSIRLLTALRAENRAHFYSQPNSPDYQNAKAELLECMCPKDTGWRDQAVQSGLHIIKQSIDALYY